MTDPDGSAGEPGLAARKHSSDCRSQAGGSRRAQPWRLVGVELTLIHSVTRAIGPRKAPLASGMA